MDVIIFVACIGTVLFIVSVLSISYIKRGRERDEFKRITLALTKLIRKTVISESNERMAVLSRTLDILGGVFSDSGIEKANNLKSVTKIREKLKHLLDIYYKKT
jgi:hypothetical protein